MEILNVTLYPTAIGLSAIAAFAIGALWYMVLFGNLWRESQRFTPEQEKELGKNMLVPMGVSFVGYIVTAISLAIILGRLGVTSVYDALLYTFILWLGFSASIGLMHTLYGGRSLKGFAIDAAYTLVYLSAMAKIILWWK